MTGACNTFFRLPELLASLAPFLSRSDLIHLARTSHDINAICIPLFWHSLDLQNFALLTRLIDSPDGQRAFRDNIEFIQEVAWRPEFSWFYFHSLWSYLNLKPPEALRSVLIDSALLHEDWGNMPSTPCDSLVPLPPLLRLTRLDVSMIGIPRVKLSPEPPRYHPGSHIHHHMWLIRLNCVTLTHLHLDQFDIRSFRVARDVCRTISQLCHLRTFRLGLYANQLITRPVLKALYFSCPSSLVDLDFSRLGFSVLTTPSIDPEMEHCPVVETLALPYVGGLSSGIQNIIEDIGQLCPLLSSVSFPSTCLGVHLMRVMEVIPAGRLKAISSCYTNGLDTPRISLALVRHSISLRQIEWTYSSQIESAVIQAVLTTCRNLQVFRVNDLGDMGTGGLLLAHAVEREWVCKGIRELEMQLSITSDGRSPAYMDDPSKATWTDDHHRHWEDLGMLYTQIGSLTHLQVLSLASVGWFSMGSDSPNRGYALSPLQTHLPGLLALEDVATGQIGYLEKFAGLLWLKELRGSFAWTNKDAVVRMGEREVDWFVEHLPALKVATFEHGNDCELLSMLRARRPGLLLRDKSPFFEFFAGK
ncbi:hypothetical protein BGZ95_009730 [Linnemannia exigua]|uniref:F-box domain-containing protein n=1 Tax=Linnemannia exigua TaxID=604196 RepID=A0AAD4DE25_9FUNG|nr:hypothetical protein BGZ95_009730 [Linnemannia exigua]